MSEKENKSASTCKTIFDSLTAEQRKLALVYARGLSDGKDLAEKKN